MNKVLWHKNIDANHLFTLTVCDYVAGYINKLSFQYNTWTTATKRGQTRSVRAINYNNLSNEITLYSP